LQCAGSTTARHLARCGATGALRGILRPGRWAPRRVPLRLRPGRRLRRVERVAAREWAASVYGQRDVSLLLLELPTRVELARLDPDALDRPRTRPGARSLRGRGRSRRPCRPIGGPAVLPERPRGLSRRGVGT